MGLLFQHRQLLWRHRNIILPLALFLFRRRARASGPGLLTVLLACTVVGALGVLAWWWLRRDRGNDGDDPWQAPDPTPAPPPPAREPAQPVAA